MLSYMMACEFLRYSINVKLDSSCILFAVYYIYFLKRFETLMRFKILCMSELKQSN